MNKNLFPNDFFEVSSQDQNSKQNSQKDHPKLLNPRNTIKIIPEKEIKVIKEETVEESMENTQLKKNNLKLIISDNSNDEIEPSTSGSKISQNTPSNSPLIYIEKNKNKTKNNSFNKNDKKPIKNEELFKVTPHFTNVNNKDQIQKIKGNNASNNQNTEYYKKIKVPLTCENRCFSNYKFNIMFETKDNGVMLPKEKEKPRDKKAKKNAFRIGKQNKEMNYPKHDYSINIKYARKNSPKEIVCSPINSSLVSFKYTTNQTSPQNYLNNKEKSNKKKSKLIYNSSLNNIKNINDNNNQKTKKQRPHSTKYISPKKKNISHDDRIKKISVNRKITERKRSCHSVKTRIILPNLPEKKYGVKNQLETEFKNLVRILPDNYEEYPEIKNNLDLIFQNIYGLKDYINKKTQYSFRPKKK